MPSSDIRQINLPQELELDQVNFKRHVKNKLVPVEAATGLVGLGVFSTIFTFHGHPILQAIYEMSGLKYAMTPLALLIDTLDFVFSAVEYQRSLNRNKGKFANMMVKAGKLALVALAVAIIMTAAPVILAAIPFSVPTLFTMAVGGNALARVAVAVRARYRMFQLERDGNKDSALYRANESMYKTARLQAAVGLVFTGVIVGLMLVPAILGAPIAIPAAVSITIAAVGAFVGVTTFGYLAYKHWQKFKAYRSAQKEHAEKLAQQQENQVGQEYNDDPQNVAARNEARAVIVKKQHQDDYYFRKGRLLNVEPHTLDSKQYLLTEIGNKLNQLQTILASPKKMNPISFYVQKDKWMNKIDALHFLAAFLNRNHASYMLEDIERLGDVKQYYIKVNPETARSAFKAWNKDVSDLEDLFDAVNKYRFGDAEPNFAPAQVVAAA